MSLVARTRARLLQVFGLGPLPDTKEERNALIASGLRAFLLARGFKETPVQRGGSEFHRTTAGPTFEVYAGAFGTAMPGGCDAIVSVRFPEVQRIVEMFDPHIKHPWTSRLSIARDLGVRHFDLYTRRDYRVFIATAKKMIPPLLDCCQDIKHLDALVNGNRTDTSGDAWSTYSSRSSIVVAWLAGNPNFDTMIEEADSRQLKDENDPVGSVIRLADYLRANVRPIP